MKSSASRGVFGRGLERLEEDASEADVDEVPQVGGVKGRGLERLQTEDDPSTEEIREGMVLIQRDSGQEFRVDSMHEFRGKRMVKLVNSKGTSISKSYDNLQEILDTEGGAWEFKN